jgi:hypothetical protein
VNFALLPVFPFQNEKQGHVNIGRNKAVEMWKFGQQSGLWWKFKAEPEVRRKVGLQRMWGWGKARNSRCALGLIGCLLFARGAKDRPPSAA